MPSPTTFALIPVAALAASAGLLFTGFGGLDRWLVPKVVDPGPVAGLLALLARTPPMDRAGTLTEEQRAALGSLRGAPDVLDRVEVLLPAASGVYRADLLAAQAVARAQAGDLAGATEALLLAHDLVPTELRVLADLAALRARSGDLSAFAATVREWRQLGGEVPVELRSDVERWLAALPG